MVVIREDEEESEESVGMPDNVRVNKPLENQKNFFKWPKLSYIGAKKSEAVLDL